MSTREQLAEVIRDGVGIWRTPLEAADAIQAAGWTRQSTIEPEHMRIENGYLVAEVNGCTCGGGGPECNYAHENGCGLEPLVDITDALESSGYGKLATARAAELEAAADEMARLTEVGRKPYAACSEDELADYYPYVQRDSKEHWLRDRAAAIRAGD